MKEQQKEQEQQEEQQEKLKQQELCVLPSTAADIHVEDTEQLLVLKGQFTLSTF